MKYLVLSLLLFVIITPLHAQESSKYYKPKAILFMLHLSTNKIEGLKKRGLEEYIPDVMEGDEEINSSIMRDMAQHFNYCPVYFFYDTCYEKAKAKRWNEITFYDYESLTKKKMLGTNSFSEYYFAEVGYRSPGEQLEADTVKSDYRFDAYRGEEDPVNTRNNGINLYDEDFKPIRAKFGFIDISLRKKGPLFGEKKFVFVGAQKFDQKLRLRFEPNSEH